MSPPRILVLVMVALGFLLMATEVAPADEPLRITWAHDKGSCTNTKGAFWKETAGPAKDTFFFFVEVHRNQDFIELYDSSREIYVRLYKTKMLLKGEKEDDWKDLYEGKWEK